MTEALQMGVGLFFAGSLLFAFAYALRSMIRDRIPQEEIDADARRLIAEHGPDALAVAEGHVQRSQWTKGNNDKIERAGRVLKAVRKSSEFHG